MPTILPPEEHVRRRKALDSTKTELEPQGSIARAAKALGIRPSAMSRWCQNNGITVGNPPMRTKEQCVVEFRELTKKLGRLPKRDEWKTVSPHKMAWRTHWTSYEQFIRDANPYGVAPKILVFDIETAPNIAYVWGAGKQYINPDFIEANGYVMCWTAKWLGSEEVMFKRLTKGKPLSLLEPMRKLLSEAHAVVHYNGRKFDVPTLNKEFLTHGMPPPSPYKQIDLLKTMWDNFLFPSNKLDYIAKSLNIGQKLRHEGVQLWLDCMKDKPEAWKKMEEYNRRDVKLTEDLYMKLRPWIKNHPNMAAITGIQACPTCGSEDFRRDGNHLAQVLKYERYQCSGCGTWFRGTKTLSYRGEKRFALAV